LPLTFTYDLPAAGETTVQLFSPDGAAARILTAQQSRTAGRQSVPWDGLDDTGHLLPAGDYRWRGVQFREPVRAAYRFSAHNSGQPPYTTDDGTGDWGGDHGTPQAVAALPDGMLLAWDSAEYGSGVIRTDLTGKKQWGTQSGAMHLATDGVRYYTTGDHGFHRGLDISIFEVATARPTGLKNGVSKFPPPPGGDEKTNQASGLAWHADILYVSYAARDLIALYSTVDGALKATWTAPAPGRMAIRPDGSLAVVSAGKVMTVKDGNATPWLTTRLEHPQGIAVATDGTAYVANRGGSPSTCLSSRRGACGR
jgi:hypothetical protein